MNLRTINLALVFVLLFSFAALAVTADDHYNSAAKKYVLEDLRGAEADLLKALQLDPEHEKARDLMQEVRKELGKAAPRPVTTTVPAPTTTVAPRPAPRPVAPPPTISPKVQKASQLFSFGEESFKKGDYRTAERYFKEVLELMPGHKRSTDYLEEIRKKLVSPEQLKFVQPTAVSKAPAVEKTLRELVLLLVGAALVAVYVIIRLTYSVIRKTMADRRQQTCPDCKLKNPEEAEFCQRCGTRLKAWTVISGTKKKWFSKFGWKQNPFTLDVIPALFTGYSAQLESILDKLSTRSGHILVYGDKGVGKTTLLRWLAANLKKDNHAIYIARPPINFDDLMRYVVADLKGNSKKKYSLYELEELVKKAKKPVVVLIDEAHEVQAEIEQQMRSLGDIERVNLVLAGLPETRDKIKRDSPPLFDRIVLECYIDHLSLEETRDLIKKRIEAAGGKDVKPFTNDAIENVFKMSKGRPRMILKVCDWVVADAIKNNLEEIGADIGKDFPKAELEAKPPEEKKA